MTESSDQLIVGATKKTAIIGTVIAIVLAPFDWRWGFGFGGGMAVSLMLVGFTILFARQVRPGGTMFGIRNRLALYALAKYPVAGVVIFFTVKAGNGAIGCFCIGFGLVYLVLLAAALASLRTGRAHTEEG